MDVLAPGGTILSVTEQGYGKRTELDEYRVQSRGGIGIINIQTSDGNGKVIGVLQVGDDDELMLITQQGKILRMTSNTIRAIGRATQGVRLIDIEGDDRAVSIARLEEQDETAKADETGLDDVKVDDVKADEVAPEGGNTEEEPEQ
jgi:DNA gyrase subunit A